QRYAQAQADLLEQSRAKSKMSQNRGELTSLVRRMDTMNLGRDERLAAQARRDRLQDENRMLQKRIDSPKYREAGRIAGLGPQPPTLDERGVQQWGEKRLWDVNNRAWDHENNLRAAGIDPAAHRRDVGLAAGDDDD